MTFWEKYYHTTKNNESYVCLGLDSDLDCLPEHLFKSGNYYLEREESVSKIFDFNKEIIDRTKDKIAAYKLNFAFYLSAGIGGLQALKMSILRIPSTVPVIIDCKAGDIANTMSKYGKAFFEEFNADAITVNPLMGEDVIEPLKEFQGKMLFVLALTSNKSALTILKREKLYREISRNIAQWGPERHGAVVGATNAGELAELRDLMPQTLFLIPGIGAQGGSLEQVMKHAVAGGEDPLILINSSRGIIFKDRSICFAEAAEEETEKLRREINTFL